MNAGKVGKCANTMKKMLRKQAFIVFVWHNEKKTYDVGRNE
jgi:hypothetical protein